MAGIQADPRIQNFGGINALLNENRAQKFRWREDDIGLTQRLQEQFAPMGQFMGIRLANGD